MYTLGFVLSALIGVLALFSAVGKLTGVEQATAVLDSAQVSGSLRQALPFIQIAGGVGALLGLFTLPGLGVAATAGLTLYFLGAVWFHVRLHQGPADFGPPAGIAVLALAATVIRAATI